MSDHEFSHTGLKGAGSSLKRGGMIAEGGKVCLTCKIGRLVVKKVDSFHPFTFIPEGSCVAAIGIGSAPVWLVAKFGDGKHQQAAVRKGPADILAPLDGPYLSERQGIFLDLPLFDIDLRFFFSEYEAEGLDLVIQREGTDRQRLGAVNNFR